MLLLMAVAAEGIFIKERIPIGFIDLSSGSR
jgi:hypothetical protein